VNSDAPAGLAVPVMGLCHDILNRNYAVSEILQQTEEVVTTSTIGSML